MTFPNRTTDSRPRARQKYVPLCLLLALVLATAVAAEQGHGGIEAAMPVIRNPRMATPTPGSEHESATGDLDRQIQKELENLKFLQEQLSAVTSMPVPTGSAAAQTPDTGVKAAPGSAAPKAIPAVPMEGAEEDFADMLYVLGEYDRAAVIYRQITDSAQSGTADERLAWSMLQFANCSRKTHDLVTAQRTYEKLLVQLPDNQWSKEAAWWAGQIKWRLLWNETAGKSALQGIPEAAFTPDTPPSRTTSRPATAQ